ncbi:MAG: hypothetical protein QOJ78_1628, partial [Pseudonocardiales bacterium]|nr:hypothetical protein [Pseudonocardiales bacterium]
ACGQRKRGARSCSHGEARAADPGVLIEYGTRALSKDAHAQSNVRLTALVQSA